MGYWPIVWRVVSDSDIILLILDVRMPELSRNKELERIISLKQKKVIYVFNKIDIVSQEYLENIKSKYEGFFVSATKNMGVAELRRDLWIAISKMKIKEPRIGVVGYPNVGKSAVINVIVRRAKAKVAKHAGTTKGVQWVKAGGMFILDSPGVIPFEDNEVMLGVLGAKDPEKLRDAVKSAYEVIKIILNYDKNILERQYGISVSDLNHYEKFENSSMETNYSNLSYEILGQIAVKKGLLLKGGIIDENRAAFLVIRDWQNGKLKL